MSKFARVLLLAGLLLGAFCFLGADDAQAGWGHGWGHGHGYGHGHYRTTFYNYAPRCYHRTYYAPTYIAPVYGYGYGYGGCGW